MEDMGPHIARNHPGMQVVKLMARKYDINNYVSLCSISPCPALPYLCFRNNRVLMKETLLLETQLERVFGMNIYIWYEYIFCIKLDTIFTFSVK